MLQHLLRDSGDLYTILYDPESMRLTVKIRRDQVLGKGKPSLARMLLPLHIYRCTADRDNCREFYEALSHVDEMALKWREVVVSRKDPPLIFCHANTYVDGGEVNLKEYEATAHGVIQSWAEREIDS